jgi:hypothetical protein
MRVCVALLLATGAASAFAQTTGFELHGYLTGRAIRLEESIPSWTKGDFGKFDVDENRATASLQLGADWAPATWLTLHADGVARHEPSGTGGRRAGIVQAYADVSNEHWRLRAGMFWLPTSRENVDPLWTSPYTITFSALNSWIGQEVRPIGADLQWTPNFYVVAGATVFRGNDTMGTVLAGRGWSLGNRLTVYDEAIRVPLEELTKPVERDLDDRNGYSARLRFQLPERAMIQFTHLDNKAELVPDLHGQEPWRTRFDVVSASAGSNDSTTLAAEYAWGWTAVGFDTGSGIGTYTMNLATGYVLLSHKRGAERWSARVERFTTHSRDFEPDDTAREHGHAVTLAWLHQSTPHLRLGLELTRVAADRVGLPVRPGGTMVTAEARYGF